MHVIARGALIGGGVGAVLAIAQSLGKDEDSGAAGRFVKSVAEGAVAGATVAFLLDRRLRNRAVELVAARGPELVDTVVELAGVAAERAERAYETSRPRLLELADLARARVAELRAS